MRRGVRFVRQKLQAMPVRVSGTFYIHPITDPHRDRTVTRLDLDILTASQVCQFCYNNIKNNMNGLCPACRRPYDEKNIEWKIISPEEWVTA